MAITVTQLSGDRTYLYLPAASYTTYPSYPAAQAAAIAASALISHAPVYTALVEETITATGVGKACRVDLPGSGSPLWVIQQVSSASVVNPKSTAEASAETYSLANANAATYVCRIWQSCTG